MATTMTTGHRRLLEHLADPACPSIRSFVEGFPLHEGEEDREEPRACSSLPGEDGSRRSTDDGDAQDDTMATEKNLRDSKAMCNGESSTNGGAATRNGSAGAGNACTSGDDGDGSADFKGGDGFVGCPTASALREAYNECLGALGDFRSTHLGIVGSYILQQQKKDHKAGEAKSREDFAGGKGTGGTPLLDFLKPLRNDSRAVLLSK